MVRPLSVLTVDRTQGAGQLADILGSTRVQGRLNGRLLGTTGAPKGLLQGQVTTQASVDLNKTVGTGQDGDECIKQFVGRSMHNRLLGNLYVLAYHLKQLDLAQIAAERCQTGTRRKRHRGDRLFHDGPPILGEQPWNRYGPSSVFSQTVGLR